jgi:hypothetical protein
VLRNKNTPSASVACHKKNSVLQLKKNLLFAAKTSTGCRFRPFTKTAVISSNIGKTQKFQKMLFHNV